MSSETAQLDTATRGHHPDSPSSLQASEACPLFTNIQRSSQASEDGTLQHKAAETRDLSILDGRVEWIVAVEQCLQIEDREIEALAMDGPEDGGPKILPQVIREKYLHVGQDKVIDKNGHEWIGVTGGFPDTLILDAIHVRATICDWKFGKEPVTQTKDNLQGMSYALAALQAYPTLRSVRVVFFAPHQHWDEDHQKRYYEHTFYRSDMPQMEWKIRTIVARKHAAQQALKEKGDWSAANPCEGLCVFCAHLGSCTKNLSLMVKASPKHALLEVPEHFGEMQISTPEHVGFAYKLANHFDALAKAIKGRCVELALTDDAMMPQGFRIVRRQDREITSLDAVVEAAKRHGVKKQEVLDVMTIPIFKIEALVKAKAEKGLGAAAVRGFGATLEELGAVRPGKASHFLQEVKTPAEKQKVQTSEAIPALDI